MRTTVRHAFVIGGVAAMLVAGSGSAGSAATTPTTAAFGVAAIQPTPGGVVGIAHPVIVRFTRPVADRTAAERSIGITSSKIAPGHFTWVNDSVVRWVPDGFWPPHTKVEVNARGLSTGFETGDAVVGVASISAHTFTVSINGQVVREMAASLGKPSRPTPVGSFTALEKQRNVTFDSRTIGIPLNSPEGYLIQGQYAVRVTWGGVYVHSAPWSVGSQGYANVSHGCINLSPDNAAWYFDTVRIGDPIIVEG